MTMGLRKTLKRTFSRDEPEPTARGYYAIRKELDARRRKKRDDARRALLERQSRRELDGFYSGPSLAMALAAQGSGKLTRRRKKDPSGKRRADNLIKVW
jgi:hypothetical protein